MNNRVIECASRAGRDFSEFMKGEKGMMEVLASVDQFGEQLRLNGCACIAGLQHRYASVIYINADEEAEYR